VLFLSLILCLGFLLRERLWAGFLTSPLLNGAILGVFLFGVAYTFRSLAAALHDARAARRAVALVEDTRQGVLPMDEASDELLGLAPRGIGAFFNTVHRVVQRGDTSATLPYLLDSLATRAEDRRALVRYLTGGLVLLGLIGTFYGLLLTIGGVREVLSGLVGQAQTDTMSLLGGLHERLAAPLGGMGVAFSSSLFGLSASLVLAFLELQLFHAQNDVQAQVESLVVSELVPLWQKPAPVRSEAGPRYVSALLETTAERLEDVVGALEGLRARDVPASRLAENVARLGEQVETLRRSLEGLERDRTDALRHELRLLTRTLAPRAFSDAPKA
jgi:hypothetical protein